MPDFSRPKPVVRGSQSQTSRGGMTTVKSFVVPIVAVVFGIGSVGTALAQAASTAPAQAPATTPAPAQKPAETKQKPMEAKTKSANGMVKSASADSLVVAGKEKVQGSKD